MNLIDSSIWVDYFRRNTSLSVKKQINQIINSPEIATCEPVIFELLRAVSKSDAARLQGFFDTFPLLPTPPSLWREATLLGQACVAAGSFAPSIDLLIAQVSLYHDAELTTFDEHFQRVAKVS